MNANTKKEVKFWSITGLILAVVIFVIIGLASVSSQGPDISLTDNEWVKGNAEAPVWLLEYSDLQCPACRGFYQYFKEQLEPALGDKIRLIYRHYPLSSIHPQAQLAAQAAEAAGSQGKFWEMHDKLFDNQISWSGAANAAELFAQYAKDLGLDEEKFQTDLKSAAAKDAVSEDMVSGTAAAVRGTPTFFINGKRVNNIKTYDELRRLLEQAGQE